MSNEDRELRITWLSADAFVSRPQVGKIITQDFPSLVRHVFAWPTRTDRTDDDAKTIAGAMCPAALENGVVKGGRGPVGILMADVDACGEGGFERSVDALAEYLGFVVTSCNATPENPRHRVGLVCDRDLTVDEFPIAWRKFQRTLAAVDIVIDEKCKNPNRLYYLPVWKRGGIFRAKILSGAPVAVDALLAAAREDEARATRERSRPPTKHWSGSANDYARRALKKACDAVMNAGEGNRNDTLNREAYSLSRLPALTDDEIHDALSAAAKYAGLPPHEIEKTIASALNARRGAA